MTKPPLIIETHEIETGYEGLYIGGGITLLAHLFVEHYFADDDVPCSYRGKWRITFEQLEDEAPEDPEHVVAGTA